MTPQEMTDAELRSAIAYEEWQRTQSLSVDRIARSKRRLRRLLAEASRRGLAEATT